MVAEVFRRFPVDELLPAIVAIALLSVAVTQMSASRKQSSRR
jgi:hypothetical protein